MISRNHLFREIDVFANYFFRGIDVPEKSFFFRGIDVVAKSLFSRNRLKLYLIWFEKLTRNSAKNTYGSVQVEINIIGENGEVYSEDIDDDDDYDYDDDIENMLRSCRYDPKLQQIIHVEGGSCTIPVPSLDQMRSVSQSPGAEQGQVPRPSQREDCPETCDCGNSPEWADCSHASNSQRCKFQTCNSKFKKNRRKYFLRFYICANNGSAYSDSS